MIYFDRTEFKGWFDKIDPYHLNVLDRFRELWGAPVAVSMVNGAIGRHGGNSKSMHNIDRYGVVRATDVFPSGLTSDNMQRAYDCAKEAGFSGIGIYPDARPSIMLHLDTRDGNLATWSAWRKKAGHGWDYRDISEVINAR